MCDIFQQEGGKCHVSEDVVETSLLKQIEILVLQKPNTINVKLPLQTSANVDILLLMLDIQNMHY